MYKCKCKCVYNEMRARGIIMTLACIMLIRLQGGSTLNLNRTHPPADLPHSFVNLNMKNKL